jgi:hypothetical protein
MFKVFLNDLLKYLNLYKIDITHITYINISDTYYMTPDVFFALEE